MYVRACVCMGVGACVCACTCVCMCISILMHRSYNVHVALNPMVSNYPSRPYPSSNFNHCPAVPLKYVSGYKKRAHFVH